MKSSNIALHSNMCGRFHCGSFVFIRFWLSIVKAGPFKQHFKLRRRGWAIVENTIPKKYKRINIKLVFTPIYF